MVMASYRISEDAKADLRRIYRHGVREYGDALADQYYDAFFDRFEELAEQPYLYQSEVTSIAGTPSVRISIEMQRSFVRLTGATPTTPHEPLVLANPGTRRCPAGASGLPDRPGKNWRPKEA